MILEFLNGEPIHALFVADEPNGPASQHVETFALKHMDLAAKCLPSDDQIGRLRRFFASDRAHVSSGIGLALVTSDRAGGLDGLEDLEVPMSWRVVVLSRPFRRLERDRVFVQGVPDGDAAQFQAKVGAHLDRIVRTQPQGSPMAPAKTEFPQEHVLVDSPSYVTSVVGRACTMTVDVAGVEFHMLTRLRADCDQLVVFGQSAVGDRSKIRLPHFQRWSWAEDVEASVIVLDDPTLRLAADLMGAWWFGTPERDYMDEGAQIVGRIASTMGLGTEDVLFYGGSLGGFSSLQMASCLPGSEALVDNPQTDMRRYQIPQAADEAAAAAFGVKSVHDTPESLLHRVSVVERFRRQRCVPRFVYMQNLNDTSHIRHQMSSFVSDLSQLQEVESWARTPYRLDAYRALSLTKGGHFPLGRHDTVRAIEQVLAEMRARRRR